MKKEFFGAKGYSVEMARQPGENLLVNTWKNLNQMKPSRLETPASVSEVQELVKQANRDNVKIKCIGGGHSFSPVAVLPDGGILVSLEKLDEIISLDDNTVTVQAGCTLSKLVHYLKSHGKQLPACPEYGPFHVGAFSGTQLHESAGNINRIPTLSSHVLRYHIVQSDGELVEINDELEFWRNNQGNAGIVIDVTFQIMPLDHVLVEYDVVSWDDFWPHRNELPKKYDEYFTIYIPLLDSFFIERRKYVDQFPDNRFLQLKKSYGSFLRKSVMILCMPWFYASVQHLPGHRFKRSTISIGVKTFFRLIFTGKTFYSEGADRAIVFHKRPLEIYNDYLYNDDSYPMALEELRNFLRQNDKLSAGTLVASYAVPQDTKCIFSRTPNGGGFSIDPVLYFSPGSEEHIALEKKIIEISRKYGARPHLNKVTNLSADLIRNGYDKNVIASYLEWCNKKDPKGIFQGKFYQMLNEAVKGSKNDGE